jgi:hypothetical protein
MVFVSVALVMAQQVTTVQKNYTITSDDELVVRRLHPAPLFDDKGKPRKPTAAELKEMKGTDPKLKGYKAERTDLKPGQIVVVTLAQAKASAPNANGGGGGKSSEKSSAKATKPAYKILGDYTGKVVRAPVLKAKAKAKDDKENKEEKPNIVVGFESLRLPGQPAPAPRDKTRLPPTIFAVRIMIVSEPE